MSEQKVTNYSVPVIFEPPCNTARKTRTVGLLAESWPSETNSPYLLTYLLTYLLHGAESFLKANWFAASQEIPRVSRNPKAHYRTHKRPPSVSILGRPNPIHIPTSHLLEIHPNIIHPSRPRSPQWSPSLRFPHQDPIHPLSSTNYPQIEFTRLLAAYVSFRRH